MERDEKNNEHNNWILNNYERLKMNELNYQEASALTWKSRQVRERKSDRLTALVGQVKALRGCGKTQREISDLLAISTGSVCNILKRK